MPQTTETERWPHRACCQGECEGIERRQEDDYGSLGSGGSYEVYKCDVCGHVCRSQMPD